MGMSNGVIAALLLPTAGAAAASVAVASPDTAHQLPLALVAEETTSARSPTIGPWGFDLAGIDPTVSPGDDFFGYANGNWLRNTVIPPGRSKSQTFDVVRDIARERVQQIIDEALAGGFQADPDAQKVANLYRSFMDEARVDALDVKPLTPILSAVRAADSKLEVVRLMAAAPRGVGRPLFNISISDDAKRPGKYAVHLSQTPLGMGDRSYYLEASHAEKKEAYRRYAREVLGYAGWPNPSDAADRLVQLETDIAEASWGRVEQRDREKMYNPVSVAELSTFAPGFPWRALLDATGPQQVDRVVVRQKSAFPKIAQLYSEAAPETLKAWMAFQVLDRAAPSLSKRFVDAHFRFHRGVMRGQQANSRRRERAMDVIDLMDEAVGRLYVARHFTPETRAKIQDLVKEIQSATLTRIRNLDWMSPRSKAISLEKVAKLNVIIGYPDKWRDYSGLHISPDDLVGNVQRSVAFEWDDKVARLNEPVDQTRLYVPPHSSRAYFTPSRNQIGFAAGLLQAPFFDPNADPAVNYGAIGAIIGHEIIHGFDDQGRLVDAQGELRDWWTPEEAKQFKIRASSLREQYDAQEPLPGAKLNGAFSMGENIADLGGLTVGYDAYRASLKGRSAPVLNGFTGDQRFFLGWAQAFRQKYREAQLRRMLVSDPHAPAQYRVNIPMRNLDTWYRAFDVRPEQDLYIEPEKRVRIW